MKRICAILLILTYCTGLFGCVKGPDGDPKPTTQPTGHTHTFGPWKLQASANCIEEGREERSCSSCGFREARSTPKTDHSLKGTICRNCRRVIFDKNEKVVELGVLCDAWYPNNTMARYVWDIKVWDGKVYRGAGDYDKNSGNTIIMAYDIAKQQWDTTQSVPDEAIHGFVEIGGTVCAPGIDPREGWEFGNYYMLKDGKWEQMRNLPNGVHCFDMIECDGKIFAGLGTEKVGNTVAVSEDGGKTFTFVPLYKDGKACDTSSYEMSRTYEFMKLNGTVYALVYFKTKTGYNRWWIFGYRDGGMHYLAEGTELMNGSSFTRKYFGGDFELNGTCYLTARSLYAIRDFSNPASWQKVSMPNSGKVSDAILRDGVIYVLSSRQNKEGVYQIVIYKSSTGEPGSFEEAVAFEYSGFPLSFDYDGECFYVGTSSNSLSDLVGMVLRVNPAA